MELAKELPSYKGATREEYLELLHEKLLRKCRSDPNQFIQYVLSYGIPNWIPQGELHQKWQNTLSTPNVHRVLMLCPRDHAKTTEMLGRIMWELGQNPNLRVKIVCQSDDIAIKRLTAIIDHIERNPRLKEVFPELRPADKGTWSKTRIYLQRKIISPDPSVEAVGILSTATGGRADLLVFDDPIDFRNTIQQPALMEVVRNAYMDVWMNIIEVDGRVWVIGTVWHQRDLYHHLLDDITYVKILDKIDDKFTPIWPEKWNTDRLIARRAEIGERAFSRAFRMKAMSDEEAIFTEPMLLHCENRDFKYGEIPDIIPKRQRRFFIGVDLGGARTETGSYTVLFLGILWGFKKVPVKIIRGRFKSPEFARILFDLCQTYNPEAVLVENNSSQEAVVQWLKEIYGTGYYLPVKGYFTGNQKMKEDVGLPSMAVEMEQENWVLPAMDHRVGCSCAYCVWLQELKDFPLGKYSDTVMASWLFREAIRIGTMRTPKIRFLSDPLKRVKRATPMQTLQATLEEDDDD